MRYQLDLVLRHAEGALVRVLGTAERRGFRTIALEGDTMAEPDRWQLRMTVEGARSQESLQQQLAKLHDCLSVQVLPCP